jgi:hypothetical protein
MRTILVPAILLATTLTASALEPVTFEWKGEMQPGQILEVWNINGSIKAETAAGSEAEISVQIMGTKPDPRSVQIDVVPYSDGILACTIYKGLSRPEHCLPGLEPSLSLNNSDIRVEYSLKVPAGVKLVAKTVNGRIAPTLPASEIVANAVNGQIAVTTRMPVTANLVNGTILASLEGETWTGARVLRTVNGSIDIEIPEMINAAVKAGTMWGFITTDFPIQVQRGFIGSSLNGSINGGGPKLEITTVNGSIHLRKALHE